MKDEESNDLHSNIYYCPICRKDIQELPLEELIVHYREHLDQILKILYDNTYGEK